MPFQPPCDVPSFAQETCLCAGSAIPKVIRTAQTLIAEKSPLAVLPWRPEALARALHPMLEGREDTEALVERVVKSVMKDEPEIRLEV